MVDRNGLVRLWNPGAERLDGWTAAEVIGRRLPVVDDGHQGEHDRLRLQASRGEGAIEQEKTRKHRDGRNLDVAIAVEVHRGGRVER